MEKYSVNTCFHLDWPKEACDSLKTAITFILEENSPDIPKMQSLAGLFLVADRRKKLSDSPEIQALGTHTREVLLRFLESYEPLGVSIEDHPDGGILVKDEDGMFAPHMMADLLNAIMKDHEIPGVVSFSWSENCDKHRVDVFSGGGAVVSADTTHVINIWEVLENIIGKMDEELEERPLAP
jgi:hypothetical protein